MALNNSAHQKLLILNPSENLSASISINALTTKINSPKVITDSGIVKNSTIGRTKVLIRPNKMATQMALPKLFNFTPFKK